MVITCGDADSLSDRENPVLRWIYIAFSLTLCNSPVPNHRVPRLPERIEDSARRLFVHLLVNYPFRLDSEQKSLLVLVLRMMIGLAAKRKVFPRLNRSIEELGIGRPVQCVTPFRPNYKSCASHAMLISALASV